MKKHLEQIDILPVIESLASSSHSDSSKWELLILHKNKLEREKEPILQLSKKINTYLRKEGIRIQDIKEDSTKNPFPIGRCNLEKLRAGRGISSELMNEMKIFFENKKL